ncbi:YqiA/YcfP family alpha/beta fold hydrolase [Cobetia sp. L2A1]|uniref:YqiA/YcfP family alpha/beta fold hydrolase n=1 Tax=Cobetia sp. L2A1 TaxID=2686360 RepID=UPI001E57E678|nr:YqiA/YcfP family alpha/beta fold hydrolase [Cobetia sp. L2A1]
MASSRSPLQASADLEPMAVKGVLYLHGFNSASCSPKSQLMKRAAQEFGLPFVAPDIPPQPMLWKAVVDEAYQTLCTRLSLDPADPACDDAIIVIGSSMGGFLTTWLAGREAARLEGPDGPMHSVLRQGPRTVLINPAVRPVRLVSEWLGSTHANPYTGETFIVTEDFAPDLAGFESAPATPQRTLVLLATADETLDVNDAASLYQDCRLIVTPGGDHGFERLAEYLPAIMAHAGHRLAPALATSFHVEPC